MTLITLFSRHRISNFFSVLAAVLIILLAFPTPVAAAVDPGLNSGNATVDRTSVPGQTILIYNTTGTSTFTAPTGVTSVRVLMVGGGGGGGAGEAHQNGDAGGGGGGGEYLEQTSFSVTPGSPMTVAVGAGGTGSTDNNPSAHPPGDGSSGNNSEFGSLTARGGGGGGGDDRAGIAGGSGGGAGGECSSQALAGGASTAVSPGVGNAGGSNPVAGCMGRGASGGGGASAAGGNHTSGNNGTAGGAGLANDITGTSLFYAAGGGGGGGGGSGGGGAGGSSIGGSGGNAAGGNGTNGTANRGAGGGGGGSAAGFGTDIGGDGGNGGAGVVIIRFTTQAPGLTLVGTPSQLSETGTTGNFLYKLTAQPTADVFITFTNSNGQLTFVSANPSVRNQFNWNTAYFFSMKAVDDALIEGPHTGTVSWSTTSTDPDYNGLTGTDFATFNITDNDSAGATVTVVDNVTSEDGDTGQFCIELTAQPSADVTIALSSSNTDEVTVPAKHHYFVCQLECNNQLRDGYGC